MLREGESLWRRRALGDLEFEPFSVAGVKCLPALRRARLEAMEVKLVWLDPTAAPASR